MSEQRVTRNVLNLLSAATALAEILDYPIIKGRINIGFQNAAELIKNVCNKQILNVQFSVKLNGHY